MVQLQATATEVGIVRAAQWLPYLAFGLLAGAPVDRVRRRLRVLWLCDPALAGALIRSNALAIGIAYAGAGVGVGAVLGRALSGVVSRRLRVGGTDITAYALLGVAFVPVVLAMPGAAALPLLVAGQLLFGIGAGLSSPITLAYRQSVTPDRLQARMNTTIRSLNWGMIAVAAPLGGAARRRRRLPDGPLGRHRWRRRRRGRAGTLPVPSGRHALTRSCCRAMTPPLAWSRSPTTRRQATRCRCSIC